jgi:hypothetical protein
MIEGQGTDFSVDIVMESKGMITNDDDASRDHSSLRMKPAKAMGHTIQRNIDRLNEFDSWMPMSRTFRLIWQAGHITGLEGVQPNAPRTHPQHHSPKPANGSARYRPLLWPPIHPFSILAGH